MVLPPREFRWKDVDHKVLDIGTPSEFTTRNGDHIPIGYHVSVKMNSYKKRPPLELSFKIELKEGKPDFIASCMAVDGVVWQGRAAHSPNATKSFMDLIQSLTAQQESNTALKDWEPGKNLLESGPIYFGCFATIVQKYFNSLGKENGCVYGQVSSYFQRSDS